MSLEELDQQLKLLLVKGKPLSPSLVEKVTQLAIQNVTSDTALVALLFRYHRKASASLKLSSLYLVDAISREARSRAKKEGKAKATSTTSGEDAPGTCASFLSKLELMLSKLVVDCWENGNREHREKIKKVLTIWTKAGTFSSSALARIDTKLLASDSAATTATTTSSSTPTNGTQRSTTPTDTSSAFASTSSVARPPIPTPPPVSSALPGIPASVLALLNKPKEVDESTKAKLEIERAIAEARAGTFGFPPPAPPSLPAISSTPPPPPAASVASTLSLDPAQLALLQQIAASQQLTQPQQGSQSQHDSGDSGWRPPPHEQQNQWGSRGNGERRHGGEDRRWGNGGENRERDFRSNGYQQEQRGGDEGWRRDDRNRRGDEGRGWGQQGQRYDNEQQNRGNQKRSWDQDGPYGNTDRPPPPQRLFQPEASQPPPPSRPPLPARPSPPPQPPSLPVQQQLDRNLSPPPPSRPPLPSRPSPPPPVAVAAVAPPPTFNPTSFNATSADSWAAFGEELKRKNGGVMPSMEMVQMAAYMSMQQQMAQAQMLAAASAAGGVEGDGGAYKGGQGENGWSNGDGEGQWDASEGQWEQKQEQVAGAATMQSRGEGEGEGEMDIGNESD